MSNLQNDAEKAVADAKGAVVAERRRLVTRLLDALRAHPRTVIAVIASLVLIVVILGLARG